MDEDNRFKFLDLFGNIKDEYIEASLEPWTEDKPNILFYHFGRRVACAILILIIGICFAFPGQIQAAIERITGMISEMLQLGDDITSYSDIIGETIAKKGIKVTLNEVIYTDNTLYASVTVNDEDNISIGLKNSRIIIDGTEVACDATAVYREGIVEQTSGNYLLQGIYHSNEEGQDISDIALNIYLIDGEEEILFPFSFTASKDELENESIHIDFDDDILIDGKKIRLIKFNLNSLASQIMIESSMDFMDDRLYYIIGTDDLGDKFRYTIVGTEGDTTIFQNECGLPKMNGHWIEFQIYALEARNEEFLDESDTAYESGLSGVYEIDESLMEPISDKITIVIK